MKPIDKDALIAEIKKRIKETESMQPKFDQFWAGQISAFKGILKILDTIEVKKEVGLEEEIHKWIEDNTCRGYCSADVRETAEHFFELGIKAQKGE